MAERRKVQFGVMLATVTGVCFFLSCLGRKRLFFLTGSIIIIIAPSSITTNCNLHEHKTITTPQGKSRNRRRVVGEKKRKKQW